MYNQSVVSDYFFMAAPFVPGTGDLKSTSYPAALLEAAYKLQAGEVALQVNPNVIQIKVDDDLKVATITAQLPGTVAVDASGKPSFVANNYTAQAFVPGTSPLKSTAVAAAFLELVAAVLLLENAKFIASSGFTLRTFLAEDFNAAIARVTLQLPVTSAVDAITGKPVISATDYL